MTTIKFQKLRWSPHSLYGYATVRMMTVLFPAKEECDEWVEKNNKAYKGVQYVSLPWISDDDLLEAEIITQSPQL